MTPYNSIIHYDIFDPYDEDNNDYVTHYLESVVEEEEFAALRVAAVHDDALSTAQAHDLRPGFIYTERVEGHLDDEVDYAVLPLLDRLTALADSDGDRPFITGLDVLHAVVDCELDLACIYRMPDLGDGVPEGRIIELDWGIYEVAEASARRASRS